jgi:antitoxin (DNA-binding transcriptional repressor) of toxin-antitoxin stability system
MTVELQDAGMKLAELADSAAQGEDVILVRDGKPVAKLTMMPPEKPKRRLGQLEGMFEIPDDFDTMFEKEIEEMFYGESSE